MTRRSVPLVIGLVSGSHVVNHAYLLLFAPAFPLLREEFGISLAAAGLALGVVNIVVTAFQLPLGYVSDTYSHTAVLVGSLAIGTLGCALAAVAPTYELLLASAAIIGVGVAGHHPAHYPLISATTTDAYRSRAYSVHGFAGALGLALPFAVVPVAVALGGGWREAFAAIAVLGAVYTVVTILAVRRIPRSVARAGAVANADTTRPEPPIGGVSVTDRIRSVVGRVQGYTLTLVGSPIVVVLTALWFVNSVAAWGVRSYAATLLDLGYGFSPAFASTAASVMLVVGAVVLLVGGSLADRIGPMPMLFIGYSSLAVLAGIAGSQLLPAFAALAVVLTLAATTDLSRPARSALTDLASERGDVGKNFALITIGVSAGGAVGPPVFGYVIDTVGVGAAFLVVAVTAAVALWLSVVVGRLHGT